MKARKPKIFQIGFNKCGTTSFHAFFEANGIRSVHYANGKLADVMRRNLELGAAPFAGLEHYTAYSDVFGGPGKPIFEGQLHFTTLFTHYPRALYVLNVRPVDNWIASRLNHGKMASRYMKEYRLRSVDELVARWRNTWYQHLMAVESFFTDKPGQFLRVDIEADDVGRLLSDFLTPHFPLLNREWPHEGRTLPKASPRLHEQPSKL